MKSQFLAILAVLLSFGIATPLVEKQGSICRNFTISVPISANNCPESLIPVSLTVDSLLAFLDGLGEIVFSSLVTGTYEIAATFCEPQSYNVSRAKTLQVLVHGATYTSGYWYGDYADNSYSWADYASKQGYSVLTFDRLGNGDSAHPNSIVDVQIPAHVSQVHNIIQMVRNGEIPEVPVPEKIIYVGHSVGSIIGNALNALYPNDVDATCLTGFSNVFKTILPSVLAEALPLPAEIEQPSRYGKLNDPGYLEFSNQNAFISFFYAGGYDPDFANLDWDLRGTISLGEAATVLAGGLTASDYTKPVMVATGEYDACFCNYPGFDLGPILPINCANVPLINILTGRNYLESVVEYYPKANFESYVVPNAGHCWQFHYSAYEAFGVMHEWMANNGF